MDTYSSTLQPDGTTFPPVTPDPPAPPGYEPPAVPDPVAPPDEPVEGEGEDGVAPRKPEPPD